MTTSLAVKLSADSGNQLSFGTDTGLYGAPAAGNANTFAWTVDNSWVGSGVQSFYQPSAMGSWGTYALPQGNAQIWPFIVTRSCRVTDAALYVTTGVASSFVNVSLFSAAAGTRQPGSKITDLLRFNTAAAGIIRGTAADSTTVLVAHTLYWMVNWSNGGAPTYGIRNTNVSATRLTALPTSSGVFATAGMALIESTSAWASLTAAPASLTNIQQVPTVGGSTTPNICLPIISWGMTNV